MSARACVALLVAALLCGCGGGGHPRAGARAAPSTCADRLPLDTLLDAPAGQRRPRPLILAVTGVTAVGFSNGGLMANALACRAAERARAVVLVASGYEGLGPCSPSRPVSVLSIHGTADQVVPYRAMRAFVATWARRDGCAEMPSAQRVEDVPRLRWHGCAGAARVEHPARGRRHARLAGAGGRQRADRAVLEGFALTAQVCRRRAATLRGQGNEGDDPPARGRRSGRSRSPRRFCALRARVATGGGPVRGAVPLKCRPATPSEHPPG